MATIVIGGHTRNIGKTSVMCALISAMPERRWTAIKITQCKHGASAEPCDCEFAGQISAISEERDATTGTDSSRYLAAGAIRSLWVRTRQGQLAEAMPRIRAEISRAENVILESNSVLRFIIKPDIYASVLDPSIADFKPSALRYLDRADALLIPAVPISEHGWPGVSLKLIERIPRFLVAPPNYLSHEFIAFVANKLAREAVTG
jgi:hypothetical protein